MTSTFSFTRTDLIESLWITIPSAISYWADITESTDQIPALTPGVDTIPTGYTIRECEYQGEPSHFLTLRTQFSEGVARWAEVGQHYGNEFHAAAARDFLAGNWDALDYDVETVDLMTQHILFGEITYG